MWPNTQETAYLVTFTEEVLNENFIFCAVTEYSDTVKSTEISPNFLVWKLGELWYFTYSEKI